MSVYIFQFLLWGKKKVWRKTTLRRTLSSDGTPPPPPFCCCYPSPSSFNINVQLLWNVPGKNPLWHLQWHFCNFNSSCFCWGCLNGINQKNLLLHRGAQKPRFWYKADWSGVGSDEICDCWPAAHSDLLLLGWSGNCWSIGVKPNSRKWRA